MMMLRIDDYTDICEDFNHDTISFITITININMIMFIIIVRTSTNKSSYNKLTYWHMTNILSSELIHHNHSYTPSLLNM